MRPWLFIDPSRFLDIAWLLTQVLGGRYPLVATGVTRPDFSVGVSCGVEMAGDSSDDDSVVLL